MRRAAIVGAVLGLLVATICVAAIADERPWIVVFDEEGCPDCARVEELLEGLTAELPPAAIVRYDIGDPVAFDLFVELAEVYDIEDPRVPAVFVGDEVVIGAGRSQEFELRNAIGTCTVQGCPSPLAQAPSLAVVPSLLRLTLFAVLFALLWWWQTS